jgi:uncharacterized protein (DUF1697 family)
VPKTAARPTLHRYVAFMRALNVGGHTVKMDQLRSLFEALGFERVESFIASGNIVFESAETDTAVLEKTIERQLEQALGYPVATFIRSTAEVAAAAAHQPFAEADPVPAGQTLNVVFLKAAPDAEVRRRVLELATDYDELHFHGRELYWWCHGRSSDTLIKPGRMERALGMPSSSRNVTTVRRLAAKYTA